jgi:hypothetical protein
MLEIVKATFALLILIVVNITLGSLKSLFDRTFNWAKFWQGVLKGSIIFVCLVGIYVAGLLNPIAAIVINGQAVSLMVAVNIIIISTFLFYAVQVIDKAIKILRNKSDVTIFTDPQPLTETDVKETPYSDIKNSS